MTKLLKLAKVWQEDDLEKYGVKERSGTDRKTTSSEVIHKNQSSPCIHGK